MAHNTVSVSQVVNDFILTLEGDDYANNVSDTLVRNYALRGIRELGFDISGKIRSIKLQKEANGTFNLPDDFVGIHRVGTVGGDGLFYPFVENNNLNMSQAFTDPADPYDGDGDGFWDREDDGTSTGSIGILGDQEAMIFNNYAYQQSSGRMYGLGGGHMQGEYRFNRDQNRLEVSSSTPGNTIVLEYVADEARSKNPEIPVYAEEALRSYIYYRIVERKRNVPANEKARARAEYYNERRKANARLRNFSKDEALKTIRKNFRQAPKY